MDPYQRGQVDMFVNITEASEAEAADKLRAFSGDLNAAIDSYLSEKENPVSSVHAEEADIPVWVDEDEPLPSQRVTPPSFYQLPSALAWGSGQPRVGGFGIEGAMSPPFPYRGTFPRITEPRDIREIPIDWRDGDSRVQSSSGLLIEEIPATIEESPTSQRPVHFISDDEEDTRPLPRTFSDRKGGRKRSGGNIMAGDSASRSTNLNPPLNNEIATNDGDDIDEDILRAVIEASQKGTSGISISEAEDDDFARAVSLSLKTAEQEKALREGKGSPRMGLSSARDSSGGDSERMKSSQHIVERASDAPANNRSCVWRDQAEDRNDLEEQPLRRRWSGQHLSPTVPSSATANMARPRQAHKEPSDASGLTAHASESNGNAAGSDEWGGLSSEEQEEAVMLEAAMFGSLPENLSLRYPSIVGGIMDGTDGDLLDSRGSHSNARPIQRPPSPTVVAQRRLREQQDGEYLASLVADREKEERAQLEEKARCLKDVEAKTAAHGKKTLLQENLRKCLVEEDLQNQAALPEEPSIEDENAVTLMVRMPDGTRRGRRFHKSDSLQCLLDYIDISCGPLAGRYQLVIPYPRKAFSDAEHGSSFQELGLNSKYETLFLELV